MMMISIVLVITMMNNVVDFRERLGFYTNAGSSQVLRGFMRLPIRSRLGLGNLGPGDRVLLGGLRNLWGAGD